MPSASREDVAERIERFVRGRFGVDPDDARLARSTDLFEEGWIDSVGLTELLACVERDFGVTVPDEALLSDAFASIDGMAAVVAELAERRAGAQRS